VKYRYRGALVAREKGLLMDGRAVLFTRNSCWGLPMRSWVSKMTTKVEIRKAFVFQETRNTHSEKPSRFPRAYIHRILVTKACKLARWWITFCIHGGLRSIYDTEFAVPRKGASAHIRGSGVRAHALRSTRNRRILKPCYQHPSVHSPHWMAALRDLIDVIPYHFQMV
jgi:hypothetical protein